ncbi:retinol dehydrogenase 10 [Elysia marginata]|uniref:Retinol dehydrogenase 10 n=1 Tax=Elysia marginata TaxID=1093978 RepID=A0AAV4ERR2_9GAST|nr:retinol dehydrogenase 10 [Elysia marginata]
MGLLAEVVALLWRVVWLWLVAIYRAVVPISFQRRKDVTGWVALVTGSGSGIGRLLAVRLARLGCRVVLWDVNQQANEETADMLRVHHPGAQVWTYTVDLSRREQVYATAKQVKDDIGVVDIVINNAGIIAGTDFLNTADELSLKTMQVNVMSHFWTVRSFLPGMLQRDQGHIVTVASSAGLMGVPGMTDYCVSKFSAVGLADCLRLEIAKQKKFGVKTTVVCPGFIDTGMFQGFKYRFPKLMKDLKPPYVADKIVEAFLTDQPMLCLPRSFYVLLILKGILPVSVFDALSDFSGIFNAMDGFVGRKED